MTDETKCECNNRGDKMMLQKQIAAMLGASIEEKDALLEILQVEGFDGREDKVTDEESALRVAEDRLEWLREQRNEAVR
jgi:hypothetical protein